MICAWVFVKLHYTDQVFKWSYHFKTIYNTSKLVWIYKSLWWITLFCLLQQYNSVFPRGTVKITSVHKISHSCLNHNYQKKTHTLCRMMQSEVVFTVLNRLNNITIFMHLKCVVRSISSLNICPNIVHFCIIYHVLRHAHFT